MGGLHTLYDPAGGRYLEFDKSRALTLKEQ